MPNAADNVVPRGRLTRGLVRAVQRIMAEVSAIDAEAAREREASAGYDKGPLVGFVVGALCLTLMEYLAGPRALRQLLQALHALFPAAFASFEDLRFSRWFQLMDLGLWVATRALGFVVVPAIASRLFLRRPLRDYGLAWPRDIGQLKPYAVLFLCVLPLLLLAALSPEFHTYYPFYRRAGESWLDFAVWELLYAFQFFCVELFFRGFLLVTARRSLGSHAVLAAMVPYCMVHFTKPVLEVVAAIPAGLVLGVLALRAHSVWGGVLLHVAVALTMDLLAILQTAGLPQRFWPLQ